MNTHDTMQVVICIFSSSILSVIASAFILDPIKDRRKRL